MMNVTSSVPFAQNYRADNPPAQRQRGAAQEDRSQRALNSGANTPQVQETGTLDQARRFISERATPLSATRPSSATTAAPPSGSQNYAASELQLAQLVIFDQAGTRATEAFNRVSAIENDDRGNLVDIYV